MVIGGSQYGPLAQVWEFNIKYRTIIPKKSMNIKRKNFGIVFDDLKKEVYVLGGHEDKGKLTHSEKFHPYTGKLGEWTAIAPMSQRKRDPSACILNNQFIYVIGGNDNGCTNKIEKYNIEANIWTNVEIVGNL